MYIKTICPICKGHLFHDQRVRGDITVRNGIPQVEITDIEIVDTCTTEELATSVLHELAGHIYDGISKHELCKILREKFSILEQWCCDIIQQLKIEMGMYCKDGEHLCFV